MSAFVSTVFDFPQQRGRIEHVDFSPSLHLPALLRPQVVADLEDIAAFGCWQYVANCGEFHLSRRAATYLGVSPGLHGGLDDCFVHVAADDRLRLAEQLSAAQQNAVDLELQLLHPTGGVRWLRLRTLASQAASPTMTAGTVVDVTSLKHAVMRERLSLEMTAFLIGSHTLGDVITNVIQLICKNLGWDWGAYWAPEAGSASADRLACRYYWHPPEQDMSAFSRQSLAITMASDEGLVGRVWHTSQPAWVEEMASDPQFLRRRAAADCQLSSGYVFPVTYTLDDGSSHSPGVLEFYSHHARQPDAQLPTLSATIGALIAQTAQRLEEQATIQYLAQVDSLTTLANRSHFHTLLGKACASAAQRNTKFALLFIDLDRFKPINDAFGHEVGNIVLTEFARRLLDLIPEGASVGRLGGDEFAILLPGMDEPAAQKVAQAVLRCARAPFDFEGVGLSLSASVGISRYPEDGRKSDELLRSADAAMYRIKQSGRNGVEVSDPLSLAEQQLKWAKRLTIKAELGLALARQELFLVYQPIVDVDQRRIHAVEALLRWRRADGRVMTPNEFIPIAEQSHLILSIGKWVARQACHDLGVMQRAGLGDLLVHINMAAPEFTNSALPQELQAHARDGGVASHHIALELTEGVLMNRPDQVIPIMERLRELGFQISLDDFGMGHSSLSLLKNLPISSLKIDRTFVRDLADSEQDQAILQSIAALGRHLRLDVIVEGVETEAQQTMLRRQGCGLLQGYLTGRPMSLADIIATFGGTNEPVVAVPAGSMAGQG